MKYKKVPRYSEELCGCCQRYDFGYFVEINRGMQICFDCAKKIYKEVKKIEIDKE